MNEILLKIYFFIGGSQTLVAKKNLRIVQKSFYCLRTQRACQFLSFNSNLKRSFHFSLMTTVWNNECNIVLCLLHSLKASTHEVVGTAKELPEKDGIMCIVSGI